MYVCMYVVLLTINQCAHIVLVSHCQPIRSIKLHLSRIIGDQGSIAIDVLWSTRDPTTTSSRSLIDLTADHFFRGHIGAGERKIQRGRGTQRGTIVETVNESGRRR